MGLVEVVEVNGRRDWTMVRAGTAVGKDTLNNLLFGNLDFNDAVVVILFTSERVHRLFPSLFVGISIHA